MGKGIMRQNIIEVVARAIGIACERPDDFEAAKAVLAAIREMSLDEGALQAANYAFHRAEFWPVKAAISAYINNAFKTGE